MIGKFGVEIKYEDVFPVIFLDEPVQFVAPRVEVCKFGRYLGNGKEEYFRSLDEGDIGDTDEGVVDLGG